MKLKINNCLGNVMIPRTSWATAQASIALCLMSSSAAAIDYNVSGFLSVGAGKINRDDIAYQDYRDDVSYRTDSSAGIQFDLNITNKLSTTVQVVAQGYLPGDKDAEWEPEFEWAYVNYRFTPKLSGYIGQLRLPYYYYSQTLDVGYSYQWVRPPTDAYPPNLIPVSNFKGGSLEYLDQVSVFDLNAKIYAGWYEVSTTSSGVDIDIDATELAGLNLLWTYEDYTFRYGFNYTKVDLDPEGVDSLISAYNGFVDSSRPETAIFSKIADDLDTKDGKSYYHSLGLTYDIGTWLVNTEAYYVTSNDPNLRKFKGGYFTLGYQFDTFTPYVSYGRAEDYSNGILFDRIDASKAENISPENANPTIDAFRDITVSVLDLDTKQSTYTAGIRYDFYKRTALKFEVQHFNLKKNTKGQLNLDEGATAPDNVTLYSIAIDYVFQ